MQLFSWLTKRMTGRPQNRRAPACRPTPRFRPHLEALEDRTVPSTFYAATASDLIQDIHTADQQGGANTIVLTAPTTSPYVMTKVDNYTDGPTALPQITSGNNLTILTGNGTTPPGYGDTLDAAKNGRLFDVAAGGSLTLQNVTLQNGSVFTWGPSVTEKGGAVYNQGALVLSSVMIQQNAAVGYPGNVQDAAGGGVWSNGSLTVENATVFWGDSATGSSGQGPAGGNAFGGALYIAGGTANVTDSFFGRANFKGNTAMGGQAGAVNVRDGSGYGGAIYVASGAVLLSGDTVGSYGGSLSGNTAQGPNSSITGRGYGGGLYVAGGSVTLTNDTISANRAGSSQGSQPSPGYGGGVFIAANAQVYFDSFTVANMNFNHATWYPNIDGTYTLLP